MPIRSAAAMMLGAALLALCACGEKKAADSRATTNVEDATAAELARFRAEENARSQVTMVDAASADGTAMPAEWTSAAPFIAPRPEEAGNEAEKPAVEAAKPAAEPRPAATEEFPSVAE